MLYTSVIGCRETLRICFFPTQYPRDVVPGAGHVSLSPIYAADVIQAQADAVFLGDHLKPVRDAVLIARRARTLMLQNLWLAVVYNAVALPIAIAGAVTPLIAALAMSG